jgi:hypothetical protein
LPSLGSRSYHYAEQRMCDESVERLPPALAIHYSRDQP